MPAPAWAVALSTLLADPHDGSLAAAASRVAPAVMLLGHPDSGHGTAVVMSRRHRLLATAAHVAERMQEAGALLAVVNGGTTAYRVDRVWFHPRGFLERDPDAIARSVDLHEGELRPGGPDVAVVRLAPGGPDLPAECAMAGVDELKGLEGRAIGCLGFPAIWVYGRAVAAVSWRGRVTQLVDLGWESRGPVDGRQLVHHDAPSARGSSGGPVFLPNGHLVAIESAEARTIDPPAIAIEEATRVDCLWELLVYHGLDGLVTLPVPRAAIPDLRQGPPDPRAERLHRAVQLIRDARVFLARLDYRRAGACCDEAIRLFPRLGMAYARRAEVRADYGEEHGPKLPAAELRGLIERGLADAATASRLCALEAERPWPVRLELEVLRMALDRDGRGLSRLLADRLDDGHLKPYPDAERAVLLSVRARAREAVGDREGAVQDYEDSTGLAPHAARLYLNRAAFWDRQRRPDLATRDRGMAVLMRSRRPR